MRRPLPLTPLALPVSPSQLAFDFPNAPAFGDEEFFVSSANHEAYGFVMAWPRWPHPVLVLVGEAGSGKSHLADIWQRRSGACPLPLATLGEAIPRALEEGQAFSVEDADQISTTAAPNAQQKIEEALFHLLNAAVSRPLFVLLTAQKAPQNWGLITKDVLSRLRLAPLVRMRPPDDAMLRTLLIKQFGDRQLAVEPGLVEWLVRRVPRSFTSVRTLVEALDQQALALGQGVTRRLAGAVLANFSRTQEEYGEEAQGHLAF